MSELVLAVDLGSSGCKTALVGLDGRVLAFAFRPVSSHVLPGAGVEQCPEDWWQAFLASAGEVRGAQLEAAFATLREQLPEARAASDQQLAEAILAL